MGTMVTNTDRVAQTKIGIGGGARPARSNGGSGGNGHGEHGDDAFRRFSPSKYKIGIWVALAGVTMMFTALTSAYIVRANSSNDWRPIDAPRLLWLSTALIVASSLTFEIAKRALKRGREDALYSRWLMLTAMLGLAFLASQLMAWRQLVAQGVYLTSNPHSSFFYVLTGAHAVHLLGGILGLDYLLLRWRRKVTEDHAAEKRVAMASSVALYWHFMGGLWIYLFLLLFLWR